MKSNYLFLKNTRIDKKQMIIVLLVVSFLGINNLNAQTPLPVAHDDSFIISQNTTLTGDFFADNGNGIDELGVIPTIVTAFDGTSTGGAFTVASTSGSFTYVPLPTFLGVDTFTYTITDSNGATSTATVTITILIDTIDAIIDDFSTTPVNGLTGGSAGDVTENDTLNGVSVADADITITLDNNDGITGLTIDADGKVQIPASTATGLYTIQYTICENSNPINCDTTTALIKVTLGNSDLAITKTVDNDTPNVGDNVVFTIELINNGPNDATGISVIDKLTTGYSYISHTASVGTYDSSTGLWMVGSINIGLYETLIITAKVNVSGNYTNIAEVFSADQEDPNSIPNNNDVFEDDQDEVTTIPIVYIVFPEEFTPNGDDINEEFEIRYLEVLYPNFRMEIANRYGNRVYEYNHNGDSSITPTWWDGHSKGKWNFGNLIVPTGVYFYTVYFNKDGREPFTGWVYLRR